MSQVYTSLARYPGRRQAGLRRWSSRGSWMSRASQTLGISNKIWIAMAIAGAIWFLLDRTTLGRRMYAVGGNAEAARYAGIDTRRVRLIAFALCGVGAAAAGILQAASTATANTAAPQPWMLPVDRRRLPGHGDVPRRPTQPAGDGAWCHPPARDRQRPQLHGHQRLPPERHHRGSSSSSRCCRRRSRACARPADRSSTTDRRSPRRTRTTPPLGCPQTAGCCQPHGTGGLAR